MHKNITSDRCHTRMTKNVGARSLFCIAGSHLFVTQCNVMDILVGREGVQEGENVKMLDY